MAAAPLGFPKAKRLLRPEEYRRVFAESTRSSDSYLTLLVSPNGKDSARLGLAISRKAVRRAADRNRIKRLVREDFRLRCPSLGGLDLVVMARPAAATADQTTLRSSLNRHWKVLLQRCATFSQPSSDSTSSC